MRSDRPALGGSDEELGWGDAAIKDVCSLVKRGAAPAYTEIDGTIVINQKCIRDQRLSLTLARRTDEQKKPIVTERVLQPFDVLVNSTGVGTLGRVAQVVTLPERATVDSHISILRPDPAVIDPEYFGCVVRGYEREIEALGEGSTGQTELSRARLGSFRIPVPPGRDQPKIAMIIRVLDEKIESNRRIAVMLEEIAATLFKARFVDFVDHDELVESEIGPIPRGWRVGLLSEVANVTMGQSPPSSTYSGDPSSGPLMVQGKGAFGARYPKPEVFCSAPTRLADPGDLLMTVRAPVGEINICNARTCLGRGVAGIAGEHPGFVEFSLRVGSDRWRARESGTIYPSVNRQQVEEFPIVIPPEALLDEFEQVAEPIRDLLGAIHRENHTLVALRDTLLPKLISGQIRVPVDAFEAA